MTKTIKIKYFNENLTKITPISKGDWIDLRCAKTMRLEANKFYLIPLGVGMKLPDDYEAHIAPRSSTFKNYGLIQTNSVGVVDNSYSGDNDQWMMPVYTTRDIVVQENDRICQFRIVERQGNVEFKMVDHLDDTDRGGFGSTGTK